MIDLVIFDLDGTLVDTAPDIAWALGATLTEIGVPAPSLATVTDLVGGGARELIRRALPEAMADRDLDSLLARFVAHYRGHLCVSSRVYPGALESLEALRRAAIPTAVVTNKPGDLARALLSTLKMADRLGPVIGDGDGFPRKPDPSAALSVINGAGTSAARTAVIGDGIPDVRMARAAGAVSVAATWGYVSAARLRAESPDFLADRPEEALRLVTRP